MKGNGHESLSKWRSVQNDEAGCLPLINSWITISQSLIISSPRTLLHLSTQNANCALYSVRHSPQFMGAFHSFVLECFIYSPNSWTSALLARQIAFNLCTALPSVQLFLALLLLSPCTCTGVNCSSLLFIWSGNNTPEKLCYQTSLSQLMVEPLILVYHIFNHLSCCSHSKPVNNIECKNAIHRKEP